MLGHVVILGKDSSGCIRVGHVRLGYVKLGRVISS